MVSVFAQSEAFFALSRKGAIQTPLVAIRQPFARSHAFSCASLVFVDFYQHLIYTGNSRMVFADRLRGFPCRS